MTEKCNIILDKAFENHNSLRPGLFESVYEHIFLKNYKDEGLKVAQQLTLPVKYKNKKYRLGYRIDLMIEDKVIVKLKSVAATLDIHKKQLLTYLKLSDKKLGLLLNFN